MSGTQGMQGGMQQMGQIPQGGQPMSQPYGQTQGVPGAGQMPQAVPPVQQGGQMPVGMGQNPYQYGAPQTSQYVQQQAQLGRMPNQPF